MNYIKKALELIKAERKRSGNEIYQVEVWHDDDCPFLNGGSCSCDPDVELIKNSPALSALNN